MAHKVQIFDVDAVFDMDGEMHPVETLEFASWEDAKAAAFARFAETGKMLSASLCPDHALFATLADYVAALNAEADWLAANPQPGSYIGVLTDDPEHWAEIDVTTPADLAAYLDAEYEHNTRDW